MASKIVVLGSINGHISFVFGKLEKLQMKQQFAVAIIVGDLFSDPAAASQASDDLLNLLEGNIKVALPTYFTIGQHALPVSVIERLEARNGEVCENLFFLGKRSTIKTSEGIRIVALGGSLAASTAGLSKDKYLASHTEGDAKSLNGAQTADILITASWPASVRRGSRHEIPQGSTLFQEEQCVADLCAWLKPKYHFSSSPELFYEREPFFHQPTADTPNSRPITRFLSLASPKSETKAKWLYAFNLDPKAEASLTISPDTTASPFTQNSKKRPHPSDNFGVYSRFGSQHHRSRHGDRQSKRLAPEECFFCLSNPKIATHLITAIAEESYLTTAKGPLSTKTTFPALAFPSHILIIPHSHSPTLAHILEPTTRASTYAEMQRYRHGLQAMAAARSHGQLGAVTWEVSRADGVHIHWQFLPVPVDLIDKKLVAGAFRIEAENEQWPKLETRDIGDGVSENADFFRIWIWRPRQNTPKADSHHAETENGSSGPPSEIRVPAESAELTSGEEVVLFLPLDGNKFRFDLQFGRRVMAKLLGLEQRLDWRDCEQDEMDEKDDAEAFKAAFKEFDFSLD